MGKLLKGFKTYLFSAAAAILATQQVVEQVFPDGFQWKDIKSSGPSLLLAIAVWLNRRATKQATEPRQ